jgi:hypothetical protein
MASFSTKVNLYLEANSKTWNDTKVSLRDNSDGNGVFIASWDYDIAQPTAEQIASYESAGNTAETLAGVLNKRKKEYPSITDQLDKIYHDGVDEWKKVIKKVKDDNPKS